jgi:hypothetical protein
MKSSSSRSSRSSRSRSSLTALWVSIGVALLAFALPFSAGATVKKEGTWPGVEKKVDLEFDGKPSEGLRRLAKEAGWSLVVANGVAIDSATNGQSADVHVDVDGQPADHVLEALFVNHDVVAHRNGTLITITPANPGGSGGTTAPTPPTPPTPPSAPTPPSPPDPGAAPSPPSPPTPPAPPVPSVRGEDRDIIGGSLVIHKDEIVHTVSVTGGSVKVEGTVTGDLVVAGGSAKLLSGARVVGNATVFGGSLKLEKGARIDGDVAIAGGSLKRDEGSVIGGRIVDDKHKHGGGGKVHVNVSGDDDNVHDDGDASKSGGRSREGGRARLSAAAHEFGQSMTRMALLFVLGCVLLALLSGRMERLRIEVASRPMRTFALGLIGTVVGSIAATVLIVILCITVIGIPVAIVGVLLAVIAVYGAIASVLTTAGAAVAGHRTQNPYLHLLLGCAAFLLLSAIPWIGGLITFGVTMIAIGALITTKVGGLLERNRKPPASGLV